jgi:LysM repeat protein
MKKKYYTICKGDTLGGLSRHYKTSIKLNPKVSAEALQNGEKIRVE